MTITHAGTAFQGIAEELQFTPWERQVVYTTNFGQLGASALDGGTVTREITIRIYVYGGFTTAALLNAYLAATNRLIGRVGSLVDSGLQPQTIQNAEFLGATKEEGPLPTAPDGGWIAVCMFRFKQLSPV